MLTARGPLVSMKTPPRQWVLAAIVGGSLLAVLLQIALNVGHWGSRTGSLLFGQGTDGRDARPTVSEEARGLALAPPTAAPLGLGLLGVRVDQQEEKDPVLRAGMSGYLLAFELISVHLVVVLIGAAYLARAKRRAGEPEGDRGASPAAKPQAD
jgi:hypothetical protein